MTEPAFRKGDFVVFTDNADGPIYEVKRLGEMLIVIRDANDDLQSVDPATLTIYARPVTRGDLQAEIARLTAALAEAEAIVDAAMAVDASHFDGDETGHSQINVDRAATEQRLHDLLAARREKGGAK